VPAVETPERTRVIIQKLLESGTHPPPSLPFSHLLPPIDIIPHLTQAGALHTDRTKISFSHKF
jgi:hypothetical protein